MTRTYRFTRRRSLQFLLGVAGLGVHGTGTGVALSRATERWSRPTMSNDLRRPGWALASPRVRDAYEAAYARLDLMATLPCYCGCGTFSPPHRDLLECFMQRDGRPEAHAAGCETCQDEALDAAQWEQDGMPWSEIRARIMATYSDVGPPTPGLGKRSSTRLRGLFIDAS